MATMPATIARPREASKAPLGPARAEDGRKLAQWLRAQAVNADRASLLIRPFQAGEFGRGSASPSNAHLAAANGLMIRLRELVVDNARRLTAASAAAAAAPDRSRLDSVTRIKQDGSLAVAAAEQVWEFYWELFTQRQTRIANRLLAADRIALDCYQYVYGGLGRARSIPSPAPFSYMEWGLAPATFRRGVAMTRIGRLPNPFPLIKVPYHRLVCPWTLGAIPHEVAHNLQADLGLWTLLPHLVHRRLRSDGLDKTTALTWTRWHKEVFADLLGVLLIGPAFIGSLMDVVGKSPESVVSFRERAVHPVPYLRVLINLELLGRIGFAAEAEAYRKAWHTLYPPALAQRLPAALRTSFAPAARSVVDLMAFTRFPQLGDKALTEVVAFRPQDQLVTQEAAARLAHGQDPGIVPERFLISAARYAIDHQLAAPSVITRNFYESLGRR